MNDKHEPLIGEIYIISRCIIWSSITLWQWAVATASRSSIPKPPLKASWTRPRSLCYHSLSTPLPTTLDLSEDFAARLPILVMRHRPPGPRENDSRVLPPSLASPPLGPRLKGQVGLVQAAQRGAQLSSSRITNGSPQSRLATVRTLHPCCPRYTICFSLCPACIPASPPPCTPPPLVSQLLSLPLSEWTTWPHLSMPPLLMLLPMFILSLLQLIRRCAAWLNILCRI